MHVTIVSNVDHLCSSPVLNVDIKDQEFKRDPIGAEITNAIGTKITIMLWILNLQETVAYFTFHIFYTGNEEDNVIRNNMEIKTYMDKLV